MFMLSFWGLLFLSDFLGFFSFFFLFKNFDIKKLTWIQEGELFSELQLQDSQFFVKSYFKDDLTITLLKYYKCAFISCSSIKKKIP